LWLVLSWSALILGGPILIFFFHYPQLFRTVAEFRFLLVQAFPLLVILRFLALGSRKNYIFGPVGLAIFFVAFLCTLAIWLNLPKGAILMIGIALFVTSASRIFFCIRAGSRRTIDIFWISSAAIMAPIALAFSLLDAFSIGADKVFDIVMNVKSKEDYGWAIAISGLFAVAIWTDLVAWIAFRFTLLPRREA
jgi:hypothetical protein